MYWSPCANPKGSFDLHSQPPSCDEVSIILSLTVILKVFKTSMTETPTGQDGQAVHSEWTTVAKTWCITVWYLAAPVLNVSCFWFFRVTMVLETLVVPQRGMYLLLKIHGQSKLCVCVCVCIIWMMFSMDGKGTQ